jgi:hypothetical protein
LDNLAGLDFIPARAIKGEKELSQESAVEGNKSTPGGV